MEQVRDGFVYNKQITVRDGLFDITKCLILENKSARWFG